MRAPPPPPVSGTMCFSSPSYHFCRHSHRQTKAWRTICRVLCICHTPLSPLRSVADRTHYELASKPTSLIQQLHCCFRKPTGWPQLIALARTELLTGTTLSLLSVRSAGTQVRGFFFFFFFEPSFFRSLMQRTAGTLRMFIESRLRDSGTVVADRSRECRRRNRMGEERRSIAPFVVDAANGRC